jgi:hypothetical protein
MSGPADRLAAQQRGLLALLKGRPVDLVDDSHFDPVDDSDLDLVEDSDLDLVGDSHLDLVEDSYLDLVRGSRGLAMLQLITTWWRRFDLERLAPLTSRALTCQGRFEEALTRLGRDADTPAAISALVMHFLDQQAQDADPLIAAVASTERALTLVTRGDSSRHEIRWDRAPAPVLNALVAGHPPGPAAPGGFCVTVSRDLPTLIAVKSHGSHQ